MAASKKRKKPQLLSHTRPTSVKKAPSLSSQATRSVIRNHHTLQKHLHTAIASGDTAAAQGLQAQLANSGGLKKYQEASIQGQSSERGGDSSKVLVEWVKEALLPGICGGTAGRPKLRMLEVGALKVDNACSRSGIFDMTRIDLHSQHPDIQTQDFMRMPLPSKEAIDEDGYDVVSLSLVVNYVGDAVGRGKMLRRVGGYLRSGIQVGGKAALERSALPALFLVLPAPCVTNSRYLDEGRLQDIMTRLGYVKGRSKLSKKLVYYLWRYGGGNAAKERAVAFKKQEIQPGGSRNNFAIVLQ
ncbi:MAG: hypothetical protein Q9201_005264 [Fulgogasparrea decipioides]